MAHAQVEWGSNWLLTRDRGTAAGRRQVSTSTWSWSGPGSPACTCCTGCASLGFSAVVLESADDVGGTWYWNRYPGRPLRHPDASTTPTAGTPSSRPSGSGRRSTPPSPRSSATCSTSPTSTTCAATSSSRPRVESATWDDGRRRAGGCAPSAGDEITCRYYVMATGCLSLPKTPDIEGADRFRRRGVLHQPLAARGRRLHRQAGRRHRHRVRRASSRSRSSPSRPSQLTVFQRTPNFSQPGPATGPCPREAGATLRRAIRERTARRRAGRRPACRCEIRHGERARRCPRRSAWRTTRRHVAVAAICSRSAPLSPTSSPTPRPTRRSCEFIRDKIRSIVQRSRDRRGAVPEGPLLRHQAAVPRHQLLRDLQPAPRPPRRPAQDADHDDHRDRHRHDATSRSSSTPSCSPPASTR